MGKAYSPGPIPHFPNKTAVITIKARNNGDRKKKKIRKKLNIVGRQKELILSVSSIYLEVEF